LALRRREFLSGAGGAAAVGRLALGGAAVAGTSALAPTAADALALGPATGKERRLESFNIRIEAAKQELRRPPAHHPTNGDEERYPNRIGNFSKTLPHNKLGEVDPAAYDALLEALKEGSFELMEDVPKEGGRFTNPLGGLAFGLEGPDTAAVGLNPPPSIASREWAADLAELYWMALLRDVPFSEYDSNTPGGRLAQEAVGDLMRLEGYRGPRLLSPSDLFRADYPGVTDGPMVSQFLLRPFVYDGIPIDPLIETLIPEHPEHEFITTYEEWLNSQNGFPVDSMPPALSLRYPFRARDLAVIAASDVVNTPYFRAILVMLDEAFGIRADAANPYNDSVRQTGFTTFGVAHLFDLIGKAPKAERHAYFQKWQVHRFLRPEAGAGRVHNFLTHPRAANYPIHPDLTELSSVLPHVFDHNREINRRRLRLNKGTYLLPQQSPSGSPSNPSFTAGHAFSAGTCVTMLKAWVQEDAPFPDPVWRPTPDGLGLDPYRGPALTLGGELNKLAHNLTWGRSMGGVHWRADNVEGVRQGEQVAIRILEEEMAIYPERFGGFTLTKFDGETITLAPPDRPTL
jgi:hypothetical protein